MEMNGVLHAMPTEGEAGWEPELAWALWNKEKSTMAPQLCLVPVPTKKL